MQKYRGYYIDGIYFHNKKEIDAFVEKQAVEAYKQACQLFASHCTLECSIYCNEKAERLVKEFGYTWAQLEEIEIEAYKAA